MHTMMRNKATEPLPEIGFLRLPQVLHIMGISKSALYAGIRDNVYPKPKRLTARTIVWDVNEIRAFVARVSNTNSQFEQQ